MKINLNNESLHIAKKELRQAEKNYAQLLEKTIKEQLDPSNSVGKDKFEKFISEKKSLVCEYVMDMGRWAIQEQFLQDYHYIEKYLDLLDFSSIHNEEYEGMDPEREVEIFNELRKTLIER